MCVLFALSFGLLIQLQMNWLTAPVLLWKINKTLSAFPQSSTGNLITRKPNPVCACYTTQIIMILSCALCVSVHVCRCACVHAWTGMCSVSVCVCVCVCVCCVQCVCVCVCVWVSESVCGGGGGACMHASVSEHVQHMYEYMYFQAATQLSHFSDRNNK